MNRLLENLSNTHRSKIKSVKQPDWTSPMLATLTDDYFSDKQWLYERKFDGERALTFIHEGRVRLLSRNKKSLNATYPELIDQMEKQKHPMILDGEIVAFSGKLTNFSRLQQRIKIHSAQQARQSNIKVYYYIFDILFFDGYDLTALPLRVRKSLLKQAINFSSGLRYTPHRNEHGKDFHKQACKKGWEGIIAKDAQSSYIHSRSEKWLKFKCVHQQELVIGGFTDPGGSRHGFGALLMGYYEKKRFHYAGKVGTGFDDTTLEDLKKKLKKLVTSTCPFEEKHEASAKGVHWVKPEMVAEIGFTEWTSDGRLRHPRYIGLRDDKNPEEVVRENPQPVSRP
ncbi:MAG: non-homologous end-joining DNA ligase [Thiohalophilus sp.]|uniref:non-homologous end-joining DNA ligase n=1 Tax=Thiohalophilus sp. TaxID=3028392 RepID=UPI0028707866|nr:non-homologous end-joining DNA ligase [Thiohalophilus sp.]MDR9435404.1 non-homologous end-joining DNA ligase [Thiohalophilus sp.]